MKEEIYVVLLKYEGDKRPFTATDDHCEFVFTLKEAQYVKNDYGDAPGIEYVKIAKLSWID